MIRTITKAQTPKNISMNMMPNHASAGLELPEPDELELEE
jgi:hypothetical protein